MQLSFCSTTSRSSHWGCFQLKEERLPEATDPHVFGFSLFFHIQGEIHLQPLHSVRLCHTKCASIVKRKSLLHLKPYPLKLLSNSSATSVLHIFFLESYVTLHYIRSAMFSSKQDSQFWDVKSFTAELCQNKNTVYHISSQ